MIARLLISPSLVCRGQEVKKILAQVGLTNPHPDLLYFPSDSKLGVEQARIIKKHFSLKPYSAKGRGVVLEDATNLTIEAQNALLKTLEELPSEAFLILAAPKIAKLLPTILSRCQIVILGSKATPESGSWTSQDDNYQKDLERLLDSSIEDRFEYIEKLKDREEFLHFLVTFYHQQLTKNPTIVYETVNREFLKELLQAEEWVNQNVNIRAILEYLMLKMPL